MPSDPLQRLARIRAERNRFNAPPAFLFDPIATGQQEEFVDRTITEKVESDVQSINKFFGVPRLQIAGQPLDDSSLSEAERRHQDVPQELRPLSQLARFFARTALQGVTFPITAAEQLIQPEKFLTEEEFEEQGEFGSRVKMVGEIIRGAGKLTANVVTDLDVLLQTAIDPDAPFVPTRMEDVPISLKMIAEVQRQLAGTETFEESQIQAAKEFTEAPEVLAFGAGIGRGAIKIGQKGIRIARGIKRGEVKIEAPKPTVEKGQIVEGDFGGVKFNNPESRIKAPEARPKSELQAEASSPIEVSDRFLAITRERKARIYESHLKADKWEKNFKESEREDAGALVEGIQNIRTDKAPKSTAKIQGLVKEFRESTRKIRGDINEYLRNLGQEDYIGFIENYIPHFFADGTKKVKTTIRKWMLESPNAKKRLLPTLKEAIALGLTPLSQDVSLLYRMYGDINWRVAANKQIAELFKTAQNGDGKPIASTNIVPEWERFNHPALAQIFETERGIWIDPDYVRIAKQAFDDPLAMRGKIGKAFDLTNAAAKTGELLFSGFHAIALTESGQAVLARGKNPLRGLFMVGKDAQRLSNKRFILSFRAGKKFQEAHPEVVMDFLRDGLELRTASADIGAGILSRGLRRLEVKSRSINIIGKPTSYFVRGVRKTIDALNKGLWEQIHEGYKISSHYDIIGKELARLPDDAPAALRQKVRETVAGVINDAFGGQEWESKFWLTPKGLQYARRAALAPDWTLSNIRIAGRTITEIKDPVVRRIAFTYWRNMILSIGAATQAMNYWSTGNFTWDNEVGHKMDIDYTPLRRKLNKLYAAIIPGAEFDPNNKQRHYIRIAKQAREIISWFDDPLKIAGSKASPLVREIFKQATGHQAGSGFQAEWTREQQQFWETIPKRIKSMAELFTPFSLRGNQFAFSLPASKGMTPFKAISRFQQALDAKEWIVFGRHVAKWEAVDAIAQAADANGLNAEQLYTAAMGSVRGKYYTRYFEALEKEDWEKANEVALILKNLGVTEKNIQQSAKRRGLIR